MTKIFLNPGHSYNCKPDAGCCYNGIKEAEICSSIAVNLKALLIQQGFDVVVFQQQGTSLTSNQQLNEIPKKANESKADLFVSIHMNGHTNETAKGTETWHLEGSVNGKKLAQLINEELTQSFGTYTLTNRGAKVDQRGLCVLRKTVMPAVLTEIGFISNKIEAEFIKSHIDTIALRLCSAICKYYGKTMLVQILASTQKTYPGTIILSHQSDDKYNCYIDDLLMLSNNKLSTCLNWLKDKYND